MIEGRLSRGGFGRTDDVLERKECRRRVLPTWTLALTSEQSLP